MKYTLIIFLAFSLLASCTNTDQKKAEFAALIQSTEDKIYNNEQPLIMNMPMVDSLIDHYEGYAEMYKDDPMAAEYMFKAANLYRNTDRHQEAVTIFDDIYNSYPDYEDRAQCLFLQAFVYENGLSDLTSAKRLYEQFLTDYPNDEFAKSAEYSLKNLGKPIEEIIKEFEEQSSEAAESAAE